MKINYDEIYKQAVDYLNKFDNENARKYLEIACQDDKFRKKALIRLIKIDLREGKYAKARQLLEENPDLPQYSAFQIYGLLENIENNFDTSAHYYNKCLTDDSVLQNIALLSLGKLNIQLGEYEVAQLMFETLMYEEKYKIQSIFGLISLAILKEDYDSAYKLLLSINVSDLTPKLLQHYNSCKMYILNLLGDLSQHKNDLDNDSYAERYMFQRLLNDNDELILSHISRHCNYKHKATNGCFLENSDLRFLLEVARDKIKNMNGNHFEMSDMYRFRLEKPIGYKGDDITRDLCVTTFLGTKDIITMYPVSLSDEFDKEGYSTSKALQYKREKGRIRE